MTPSGISSSLSRVKKKLRLFTIERSTLSGACVFVYPSRARKVTIHFRFAPYNAKDAFTFNTYWGCASYTDDDCLNAHWIHRLPQNNFTDITSLYWELRGGSRLDRS